MERGSKEKMRKRYDITWKGKKRRGKSPENLEMHANGGKQGRW